MTLSVETSLSVSRRSQLNTIFVLALGLLWLSLPLKMAAAGGENGVTLTPAKLSFPTQVLGTVSAAKLVVVSNSTKEPVGLNSITIAGDFDTPSKTCLGTLPPGAKCTISVTFAPTAPGPRTGALYLTDSLGNTNSVTLEGTGTQADLSPKALDFGTVAEGSAKTAHVTLENEGFTAITIFAIQIAGPNASVFSIAENRCGTQLAPDQQCEIVLSFAPTTQTTLTATMTVSDDGGGSPQSVQLTGVGGNPIPSLTAISPHQVVAGKSTFTMAVTGTNFLPNSTVQWNGGSRVTKFVSSTRLTATILASDVAFGGTATVTVFNPAPAGGSSNPLTFTIITPNPVPSVNSIQPNTIPAGSGAFSLAINGFNFVSNSVVRWNGSNRPTTFLNSNALQATISASDVANQGNVQVSVFNPAPGGGTSNSLTFTISLPVRVTTLSLTANDLVWDPFQQKIYASVPSSAGANGNTVTIIDPVAGTIGASAFAGSEPARLAISDDATYLYAGLNGSSSVQRMVLPALTQDINIPLGSNSFFGPYFALDLQVAPGSPHTTAISLGNSGVSPAAEGGITIFDDATARPTTVPGFSGTGFLFDSLQWGADATALYAANNEDTGFDFYTLSVDSSGVTLTHDYPSTFSSFSNTIHFDAGTKLIYSDDGHVVDPSSGSQVGTFAAQGVMVPDSTLGRAFFLGTDSSTGLLAVAAFDLTHFTFLGIADLPGMSSTTVGSLVRWGQSGLAFRTINFGSPGQVILVSSPLILPPSQTNNPIPATSGL